MNNWTTKHLSQATLLGAIGLLCLTGLAGAEPAQSRFAEGNQAYLSGDYSGAIRSYEAIAQHEGVSVGLLHNLARAHQANGDLGLALLHFERAQWLAPRDAGVRAGLRELRREAAWVANADPRWTRPFLSLSLNEWSWLAAAAWAVIGGLMLARGLGIKRLPFKTGLAVSVVLLAVSVGGIAVRLAQMDHAVVIGDQVSLRVSPYAAAVEIAVVGEGRPLTVTGSHGEFFKVRTTSGQTGWMAATDVGRITVLDFTIHKDGAEIVSAGNPGLKAAPDSSCVL